MNARYDTVTFLSDFGLQDEFVGVVESVVRDLAPHAVMVHLNHSIPAFDIRAGGLSLARSIQYVAPGVLLAVVDPGVGTERRPIAVEVGDGAGVLVGPDNGVLAPAVAMAGGATRAVQLTNPEYQLARVGATFDGRDVFGPAAAHLCNGVPLENFGPLVDPVSLVPGTIPIPRVENDKILAEVLWIDRFGNAQLNVGPDEVEFCGESVLITVGDQQRVAPLVQNYDELGEGKIGLVLDSYGLLSLSMSRRDAASELGIAADEKIILEMPT
ncbi:MAG: S-adenosyl-l-methionine hydroxide adenosyltransferase family protein [Acidimicrobiales bacterium]